MPPPKTRKFPFGDLLTFTPQIIHKNRSQSPHTNESKRIGRPMRGCAECLPESGFGNPKEELLSLIFRAMARHRLGDTFTARKLLEQARQELQEQLPTPVGPPLSSNPRPVTWSMIQTVLREAEAVMPPETR
jgi:hypothetical protein